MKNGGGTQTKTCWKWNSDGSREETKLEVCEILCVTNVKYKSLHLQPAHSYRLQLTDLDDGSCEATTTEKICDISGNCSDNSDGKTLDKATGPCSSFKTFLRCPY